jgi:hypothetical protein
MKAVATIIAVLLAGTTYSSTSAQLDNAQQAAGPTFPIPELQAYVPKLARAVELIGNNRVEDSFNSLATELNPAFRNPGAQEKFRESWLKLFLQVGRLRLEFDSYDIVGYYRVSSQSFLLYGIANGANGPVVFDFRVFRYRGRWHVHGFTFNMIGWDRKPVMHKDSVKLAVPVTYPLGNRPIAKQDRPSAPHDRPVASKIVGLLTHGARPKPQSRATKANAN